jgi:chemotaxis protein methyltransferase WspC
MSLPPAICERLRAAYGLDTATLGDASLRAAWERRARAAGGSKKYQALLAASPAELTALVEEILVPESWFFRDGAPFAFLESWAARTWRPAAGGRVLRVLSVPCAAGQEPYSIAMALLDAGLRPGQFVVCAGDVSARMLEMAARAEYPAMSFRGRAAAGREHHFEPVGRNLRRVRESVRATVHFRQCNLVNPDFFRDEEPFHLVFCRNVLVYFDAAARRRAVDNLRRCLAPGGLFFCGHADSLPMLDSAFASAGPPAAFVYQLRPAPVAAPLRPAAVVGGTRPGRRVSTPSLPPSPAQPLPSGGRSQKTPAPAVPANGDTPATILAHARRLADAGVLHEAEALCGQYLKSRAPHPDAFFLLGQLAAARGRSAEAENHYRKTLYLNARHPEALWQLALLAERRGDRTAAARLRQRAKA